MSLFNGQIPGARDIFAGVTAERLGASVVDLSSAGPKVCRIYNPGLNNGRRTVVLLACPSDSPG
jgi:hypothetical protein